MNLYSDLDSKALVANVDAIMKKAEDISLDTIEPTRDKMWEIIYIVRDFVIEKKRKIYGGFALNKLIEAVAPEDKFYDDDNIKAWDIDFYSPYPIEDAKEIADRLYAKGFKHIVAREAQHEETYKIFVETIDCADITYMPSKIYNKVSFREVNRLTLTAPHFMMIDYFRVLTDPMTSYFRLEKTFVRLCLLLKYNPIPKNNSPIKIAPPDAALDVAFHTVNDFLIDRKSTIVVGMYAYNHLINASKINKQDKKQVRGKKGRNTGIDFTDVNYYEIISTAYKEDARELILKLKEKFPNSDKITYVEHSPFFQYFGESVNIYYNKIMVCKVYNHNNRCTPFFDVPALYFKDGGYDEYSGKIRIGTFAVQILYNLINTVKAKTDDDQNTRDVYYALLSHLSEMRNYYFAKTSKTIFDESLFQEFVLNCVGYTQTPQMEKAERIERKKKLGKLYSWNYNPEKPHDDKHKYYFKNTLGEPVSKGKIKLDKNNVSDSDNDSDDSEYSESDSESGNRNHNKDDVSNHDSDN
jgi:hypothetical protein